MSAIVFLDIDGVLNSTESAIRLGTYKRLCQRAVANLNLVTLTTQAEIVVSSSWRIIHDLARLRVLLSEAGVKARVRDVTPQLVSVQGSGGLYLSRPRRDEIRAWLDAHPDVDRWVVLDDSSDAGPDRYVQPDFAVGMSAEDAQAAISILEAA